jgi:tRNA (cmo5U34)-methyltransferase
VVSSLAVHHLDADGKRELFADMHAIIAPGGALVLADLIQPTSPEGLGIAARLWDESTKERSLQLTGQLSSFERFQELGWNNYRSTTPDPVDKPSTLFEQLTWLSEIGFERVDVFWMKAGHAIFGGYRGR